MPPTSPSQTTARPPDAYPRRTPGGFYRSVLLPRIYGWSEANLELDAARQRTVEYATGHVIEFGSGLGSTLDLYPHEITSLTTVDPNRALNARLRRRMRHLPFPTDVREGVAEHLPVRSAAFDTVVSTFALGAVEDLDATLIEIRRVLKPGGRLLLAELALDEDPMAARRQQRWSFLRNFLSGGYRLANPPTEALEVAGLRLQRMEMRRLEQHGWLLGTLFEALVVPVR